MSASKTDSLSPADRAQPPVDKSLSLRIRVLERRIQLEEQKLLFEISRLTTGMRVGPMRSHELEDVRRHLRIIAKELDVSTLETAFRGLLDERNEMARDLGAPQRRREDFDPEAEDPS